MKTGTVQSASTALPLVIGQTQTGVRLTATQHCTYLDAFARDFTVLTR